MNKEMLKSNPKLIIKKDNIVVYKNNNIQELYLYPLSILDYINNISKKKPILLNIISLDTELNYIKVLSNNLFENLLCIELLFEKNITDEYLSKIKEIIDYAESKKIKLTFNIKDLTLIDDEFIKINIGFADYIKCFFEHKSSIYFKNFLQKIKLINNYKKPDSLLHIKSYLNETDVSRYKKRILEFKKYNVDIYQVSKELIPLGISNKLFPQSKKMEVRKLEEIYSNYNNIKFISVKDLSTLYYPRFTLDERNCKHCNACVLKPYLFNEYILPCKVNKVMNNIKKWGEKSYNNLDKFSHYGLNCDDCASIFENDILGFIEENYLNGDYKFDIICGDNSD